MTRPPYLEGEEKKRPLGLYTHCLRMRLVYPYSFPIRISKLVLPRVQRTQRTSSPYYTIGSTSEPIVHYVIRSNLRTSLR